VGEWLDGIVFQHQKSRFKPKKALKSFAAGVFRQGGQTLPGPLVGWRAGNSFLSLPQSVAAFRP